MSDGRDPGFDVDLDAVRQALNPKRSQTPSHDALPWEVRTSGYAIFETQDLDRELAELLHESSDALAGVRGPVTRTLSFLWRRANILLELELRADGSVGGHLPMGSGPAVQIVTATSTVEVPIDAAGGFVATGVGEPPFSILYGNLEAKVE